VLRAWGEDIMLLNISSCLSSNFTILHFSQTKNFR
jgi:hypothetical protein